MGFLDKAKKLAEDAQAKADEMQRQFNEKQGSGAAPAPQGAPVEYDQHGRPIAGDPDPAPPPPTPFDAPGNPAPPPGPPSGGLAIPVPAPPATAGAPDGPKEGHEPPPLTSGDPLAG